MGTFRSNDVSMAWLLTTRLRKKIHLTKPFSSESHLSPFISWADNLHFFHFYLLFLLQCLISPCLYVRICPISLLLLWWCFYFTFFCVRGGGGLAGAICFFVCFPPFFLYLYVCHFVCYLVASTKKESFFFFFFFSKRGESSRRYPVCFLKTVFHYLCFFSG